MRNIYHISCSDALESTNTGGFLHQTEVLVKVSSSIPLSNGGLSATAIVVATDPPSERMDKGPT